MRTSYSENEQSINLIRLCLADEPNNAYWQARLEDALKRQQLYQSTELKERPMLDYGDWQIIFSDDSEMIAFLDNEIEEFELPPDEAGDLYEGVAIEYVLMTGVELGRLEIFEM